MLGKVPENGMGIFEKPRTVRVQNSALNTCPPDTKVERFKKSTAHEVFRVRNSRFIAQCLTPTAHKEGLALTSVKTQEASSA